MHVNECVRINVFMQMRRLLPTMCCCPWLGDLRLYGTDTDQKDAFITIPHVEDVGDVFEKLSALLTRLNDMHMGMQR